MTEEFKREEMTEEAIEARMYQLLGVWETAKQTAVDAVEAEKSARDEVVKWCSSPEIAKGTENIPLQNNYKLKIVKGINYNVDQAIVKMQLDAIAASGPEGATIANRLMKWKASLSITEYNLLSPELKVLIDRCITTTDSTPTIEIVAPSTKGKAKAASGFTL